MLLDIRIKTDLYRHRKYKRLKRIVGSAAMEHLITFWCNVAEQCPNGALNGWSNEDIESAAEWYGDEGVFCDAMIQSEFLDVVQDGDLRYYTPHDWEENQPWVVCAKERSEAARKAGKASALARKEKYGTAQPPERSPNGSFENRSERLPNGSRTPSPSPTPNSTPPTPPRGDGKKPKKKKADHKESTKEIFDHFVKAVNPPAKHIKRQSALNNIAQWEGEYPKADLIAAARNYAQVKSRDPGYVKGPSNFYGVKGESRGFFVDYLPGNFDPTYVVTNDGPHYEEYNVDAFFGSP